MFSAKPIAVTAAAFVSLSIFSVFTPARAQDGCDAYQSIVTTTPSPPQNVASMKHYQEVIERKPQDTDLVLIGDSLMDYWSNDNLVQEDFPRRQVWNFGLAQDRTQNTLWRLDNADMKSVSPRDVVILVGTNNTLDSATTSCGIFAGIKAIVEKSQALWPQAAIFVISIPPKGADFKNNDALRLEVNQSLADFAGTQKNLAFVQLDDNQITCGNYGKPALDAQAVKCTPAMSYVCTNYRPDNLHFERDGYRVVRQALGLASRSKFRIDRLN